MGGRQFIAAGSFIDGSGAGVRRNIILVLQDTIITAIVAAEDLPSHPRAAIADLSQCTILPPLVDCSVSLTHSPSVDWQVRLAAEGTDLATKAALVERQIRYCHAYGVLGVAANDSLTRPTHDQVELASGGIIDIRTSGGLCQGGQDCVPGNLVGRDFLKIAYSSNIEDQEARYHRLDQADFGRLLQHRGNNKAVVVANGRQQVAEALAAGCDAIEQGYGMGEANLQKMAAQRVLWIPSLLRAKNALDATGNGGEVGCRFSQRYLPPGRPDPGAEAFWQKMLAAQLTQLRLARKLGVTTAVGTGAGSAGILHGESVVEEMKLFIKADYSLTETIRCASENGARFFGMAQLGTLAAGRPATFLIARGSVQQLPRKLSYLEGIYVNGTPSRTYHKNPGKAAG